MSMFDSSEAVVPAINSHLAAELIVEGETWPVFVWTIDHRAGRVLVDTGMIDVRPEIDDMSPTPHPENIPRDVASENVSAGVGLDDDHLMSVRMTGRRQQADSR